ncbi:MAG: RES family NAD+ phosphorylase [Dissulfurispiraceae bacterium]
MFDEIVAKVAHFDNDTFRNIPTIIKSENLLDDLSANAMDMAYGEDLVSEPEVENLSPIITRPFQYGVSLGEARQLTRFSDGSRFGVWYGSTTVLTTIHETVYSWLRRFAAIKNGLDTYVEVVAHRRIFKVHVKGMLIDILGKEKKYPALVDKTDYSFTHALGSYLHDQGVNGLIFRSARDPEGVNIGAFKQSILSDVRHHSYLRYRWKPGGHRVVVEKRPGRTWKVIVN